MQTCVIFGGSAEYYVNQKACYTCLPNISSTVCISRVHRCGQTVACVPITQRAGVRSRSGQVSWVRFFRGFSSPVRQMSGSFRPPRSANIIWPSLSSSIIIIHYWRQWPEMLTRRKTSNIHTCISRTTQSRSELSADLTGVNVEVGWILFCLFREVIYERACTIVEIFRTTQVMDLQYN